MARLTFRTTLKTDINYILSTTDSSFWLGSTENLSQAYAPYIKQPDRTAAKAGLFLGTLALSQGLTSEILMKAYGTNLPLLAAARFWMDWDQNFPRIAMKFVSRDSAVYARLAAKAALIDQYLVAGSAKGALSWVETRWGFRLITFGIGGPVTAVSMAYLSLISSTAEKSQDEVGENYFETSTALAESFAVLPNADAIFHVATAHSGLALQIRAFAEMLRQASGSPTLN